MVSKKLCSFLDKHGVSYEMIEHRTVFTAYDTAATLHIPLESVIKTLCVTGKNGLIFVLVPANRRVDFKKIATLAHVPRVSLPSEKEMVQKLKLKLTSAPPLPLGFFYSCQTLIEKSLTVLKKAYLGSGDFTHSLICSPKALAKLPEMISGSLCQPGKQKMIIPKPPRKKKNVLKKKIIKRTKK